MTSAPSHPDYEAIWRQAVAKSGKIHSAKQPEFLEQTVPETLLNENERAPGDQPSIGIILCAEKDDVEVEFALKTKSNPIGVAEYQLQSKLPSGFKGRLPSAKQLADAAREVLPPGK